MMSSPNWAMALTIRPNTPIGAIRRTCRMIQINPSLMMSSRVIRGFCFSSDITDNAMPKNRAKNKICRILPDTSEANGFSGMMPMRVSQKPAISAFSAYLEASVISDSGISIPLPGLKIIPATRPRITEAAEVPM